MPILNIQIGQTGLVGVIPRVVYIYTNDTLAAVTTAGYLNLSVQNGFAFAESDMALVTTKTTPNATTTQVAWLELSHSASTGWSLVPTGSPGSVVLPTIANHLATYTNVTGGLSEDPATAISGGNIQAGLSGTAGFLSSFPSTAAKGSLRLTAVANTGDTLVTISNALHGQASVYSIPDSGSSTANLILSKTTGTQHITVGGLQVDAGVITSGISTGGQVGSFAAFPTTASKGSLRLTALVNATGDFYTEISNSLAVAQSQVISIPDVGAATGQFLVKSAALVSGNVIVASGTGGKVADGGFAVKANTTAAYGGGGVSNAFTATGLTTSSIVTAVILTSTNAVAIAKAVPTANTLTVTFTGDPGAATTISWHAITPAV